MNDIFTVPSRAAVPLLPKHRAAAEDIQKYAPDQPRDWRGRWVDEANDAAYEAADFWTGDPRYPRQFRDYLSGGTDPKRSEWVRMARALLTAANHAPPTTVPLYRGIPLSEWGRNYLRSLEPGDTLDLNLASWTTRQTTAEAFAGNAYDTHGDQRGRDPIVGSAVFAVEPGAHAYDATEQVQRNQSEGGFFTFDEFISGGRFAVVSNSEDRYGRTNVSLRQVATLRPPPVGAGLFGSGREGTLATTVFAANPDITKVDR